MKIFKTLFLIALLTNALHTYAQNIINVNLDVNTNPDYTDLQEAIDAAESGDIIYVHSGYYYGNISVSKQLTLMGIGYFHAQNSNSASDFDSQVPNINFQPGSEGSMLMSLKIDNQVTVGANNITIQRCFSSRIAFGSVSNTVIDRCYISAFFNVGVGFGSNSSLVKNCYIGQVGSIPGCEFRNNVIASFSSPQNLGTGNIYINNICTISYGINGISGGTNTFFNNIFLGFELNLAGSGNMFGISFNGLFITSPTTPDETYQLANSSPAIGVGQGGVDCGMFGGNTPYILLGLPPIPVIEQFEVTADSTTFNQNLIKLNLRVRANN